MKKYLKLISLLAVLIMVVTTCSCMSFTSFENLTTERHEATTSYSYTELGTTTISIENITTEPYTQNLPQENTTVYVPETTLPQITEVQTTLPEITTSPVTAPETTLPAVTEPDYSSYSKSEILDTYKEALSKTRAYTGALTVNHTEAFNADIKDAHPGGALTELLASNIVKLVGSEGQQTLNFNGGKATNKDGETVPILLPQRTDFSLSEAGIKTASVKKDGNKLRIRIVLVPETVSMGEIPPHNASSVGYLDTSEMSFSIITISRVDITYSGSVIDAVIRDDGYIESVVYTINMSTYAELSGMGISGYGTLEGAQTEKWELNW